MENGEEGDEERRKEVNGEEKGRSTIDNWMERVRRWEEHRRKTEKERRQGTVVPCTLPVVSQCITRGIGKLTSRSYSGWIL